MPDQALLVQSLVQLADSLVDDFDVIDLLSLLSDRCTEVLDVSAAGVMLAAPGGELQVVASSSDAMRVLELFELQADEGPCVDCYRSATPIVNSDLAALKKRWPRFAPRAVAAGFRSAYALPMRLRGRTIGALNLFRTSSGALDDADVQAAQALADVATIAILQHKTAADAQALNTQLQVALNSRVIVEQAKGRISEAAGIDMDQAFRRLRNHSRNHSVRLVDLCTSLIDGTMRPGSLDPLPPGRQRG
jgi:GAF domain-containing protein